MSLALKMSSIFHFIYIIKVKDLDCDEFCFLTLILHVRRFQKFCFLAEITMGCKELWEIMFEHVYGCIVSTGLSSAQFEWDLVSDVFPYFQPIHLEYNSKARARITK